MIGSPRRRSLSRFAAPWPRCCRSANLLTDPLARWTAAPGGPAFYAYSTNYLIDAGWGIILDVEATPAHRTAEVDASKVKLERVEARFDLTPERFIADTAYGSVSMLAWLVEEKAIAPHVPVWDKTERTDGTFSRSDFAWVPEANAYRCPAGHVLRPLRRHFTKPRTGITKANTIIYRASQHDCCRCDLKSQCCPNTTHRKITRNLHEAARDMARDIAKPPPSRPWLLCLWKYVGVKADARGRCPECRRPVTEDHPVYTRPR